ncbi:hypothetical protein RM550_26160 [Streptomyces sp. DSM 41527]|uniref:Uncharacterized protein n=1 Tax=Streptomyces mooreae TaxID=3075523 RepID=A0ABU2TE16_9ACTN|nr:hypothetical protein [Streptomyces sp. DSM 41527]MDT0459159.1 hypothetical protein [Streptomyces sp. DSM 41527]
METIPQVDRTPAQEAWEEHGTVLLHEVVEQTMLREIAVEAVSRLGETNPYVRHEASGARDGSFAAPVHCGLLPAGELHQRLAFDKELLTELRQATGMPRLIPRGGSVVVYRPGDFQGLHTDTVKATVTVGIALTPDLPPMCWAPTLRDAMPDDLSKVIADKGIFPECKEFQKLEHPHLDGSLRAFAGYSIPHWRMPYPDQEIGLLATFSYMDL